MSEFSVSHSAVKAFDPFLNLIQLDRTVDTQLLQAPWTLRRGEKRGTRSRAGACPSTAGTRQLHVHLGLMDMGRTNNRTCYLLVLHWPRVMEGTESTVRATGSGTAGGGRGDLWQGWW